MNSTIKSLLFWMVLIVVGVLIWNFSASFNQRDSVMTFTEFMQKVDSGQVASVTITGNEVTGVTKESVSFRTYVPSQYEGFANKLIEKGVLVTAKEPSNSPWATLLYSWAPILLMIGFWIFIQLTPTILAVAIIHRGVIIEPVAQASRVGEQIPDGDLALRRDQVEIDPVARLVNPG